MIEKSTVTVEQIRGAERLYKLNKKDYACKKAELWLNTNWEEVFEGKSTQKDREYWIDKELAELGKRIVIYETEYHYLLRLYNQQQRIENEF